MNRIVLIGNGFDLAHGLPTRYEDFINWYWDQRVNGFSREHRSISRDILCEFRLADPYYWSGFYSTLIHNHFIRPKGEEVINRMLAGEFSYNVKHSFTPFFSNIITSIKTKGWVDIENEYYRLLTQYTIENLSDKDLNDLNEQLHFITERLIVYLKSIGSNVMKISSIENSIYSPINYDDVSIEGRHFVSEYVSDWIHKDQNGIRAKINQYGIEEDACLAEINDFKDTFDLSKIITDYPSLFLLPDHVLLLNFNYTYTADLYESFTRSSVIHIHGELNEPQSVIFGYGDELDEKYKELKALNNNECLKNIKSIKYLESDNYRNVLAFMESAPFQVLIMGHSCGNSDRTLLNTLFEHKNCISIKPYYHQKVDGSDNYLDIIQNISRNFTDMKLMRDRVVNKTYCEPLPQANS